MRYVHSIQHTHIRTQLVIWLQNTELNLIHLFNVNFAKQIKREFLAASYQIALICVRVGLLVCVCGIHVLYKRLGELQRASASACGGT